MSAVGERTLQNRLFNQNHPEKERVHRREQRWEHHRITALR